MNRNDLPKVVQDKISGYAWIKLGQLKIEEKVNLTIQTKDSNCVHEIESKGYQLYPVLENWYTVMRSVDGTATMCDFNDLVKLASLECTISIDISAPMGIAETKNP
jgi:hypothetical protein